MRTEWTPEQVSATEPDGQRPGHARHIGYVKPNGDVVCLPCGDANMPHLVSKMPPSIPSPSTCSECGEFVEAPKGSPAAAVAALDREIAEHQEDDRLRRLAYGFGPSYSNPEKGATQ